MPDLPTLRDLRDRVRRAEGPNFALETKIWSVFRADGLLAFPPPLTASLDAAIALVERAPPNRMTAIEVLDEALNNQNDAWPFQDDNPLVPQLCKTLLLTYLDALIAQAESSHAE